MPLPVAVEASPKCVRSYNMRTACTALMPCYDNCKLTSEQGNATVNTRYLYYWYDNCASRRVNE